MKNKEKRLIIYVVEDEKAAQFRYRVHNVIETLGDSKKWEADYYLNNEIAEVRKRAKKASIVVIERQAAKDSRILDFIDEVKSKGTKVLFDLDDLIFDYRDLFLLMRSTNSRNIFYWIAYLWGVRRIAKRVDGFLCTNEFLGQKLKRSFKKPYKVIRNSLNKEQITISDKCIKEKKSGKFSIGYFSGSPTHVKDFQMVERELLRFLDECRDVELKVVGYMDFSDKMRELIKFGRVKEQGVVDYLELQKLMASVDVNLAPLVVNDFTNCKSDLKFFESAVVETVTIASPTYAFSKAIVDGENGFLAGPNEWYNKLKYTYEHRDENKKIAKYAREYAIEHYYGRKLLEEIEEAYDCFC